MAGGARPGARHGVLRAMGLETTARADRPAEGALCPACGLRELEFFLGSYGQTLETCPNPRCTNHPPHPPQRTA